MSSHTIAAAVVLGCLAVVVAVMDAPAADRPHVDRHGDPLPPRAIARFGSIRFRHGGHICGVAFAPDGKTVASAGYDNTIRFWDVATGRKTAACKVGEGKTILSVAFSPKGDLLASSSWDGLTYIWDVAAGKPLHKLGQIGDNQGRIAFSHDGKVLAARAGATLRLYDAASGKELLALEGHKSEIQEIEFLPGDKQVVSCGNDNTVRLWDIAARKEVCCFRGHTLPVNSLALSPHGTRLVSGGGDDLVIVWDMKTGEKLRESRVPRVADRTAVSFLKFSPDGKHFASSGKGNLILWDIDKEDRRRRIVSLTADFSGIAFSADGKVLAAAAESGLRLWDVVRGRELHADEEPSEPISALTISPDGRSLAFAAGSRIHLRDVADGRELACVSTEREEIYRLHLSSDGRLLAADDGKVIDFWSRAGRGKDLHWVKRNTFTPPRWRKFMLSPDLQSVATWEGTLPPIPGLKRDTMARVYDASSGKEVANFSRAAGYALWGAFSSDGESLALGYSDGWLRIYEIRSGTMSGQFHAPDANFEEVAFLPGDRAVAASARDGKVRVWERATGRLRATFLGRGWNWQGLTLSPDGRLVSYPTPEDQPIIQRVADGREVAHLIGHRGGVRRVCFAPNGRTLATASEDATVLLWDIADLVRDSRPAKHRLDASEIERLWTCLAESDAAAAYRAMMELAATSEQSLPLLRDRLKPAQAVSPEQLSRLLADLDSEDFDRREKATRQLEKHGDALAACLRKTLQETSSLEARRRLQQVLERVPPRHWPPESLRALRCLEVLEDIGTAEAARILTELAGGAPAARLTREARASLRRVQRRPLAPK